MKNRNCPNKDACWDYDASNCGGCAVGQKFEEHIRKIKQLQAENAELRARLENHDLPVNVWDTVYCIRDCGTVGYRIDELKVIEIVFEYNNQMRIKTCYGLSGYEKWTFGLDCFADPAKAEARLKELQGGER